jgi:hypothetical protein
MDDMEDQIFSIKSLAEGTLAALKSMLARNGAVTVEDFFVMIGGESDYNEDKTTGWTSFDGSEIVKTNVGWALRLPDPVTLN